MKTKTLISPLAVAVASLVSSGAHAISQSPNGTGSYLNYPYYTVQGGNNTLISVVNQTTSAKVVKVRFLEAKNNRKVLEFNLFLAAKDVWTAALVRSAEGGAVLTRSDLSCTVPAIPMSGVVAFRNTELNEVDLNGNMIDNSLARTAEGSIEIIEMARLDATAPGSLTSRFFGGINAARAATPINGVPGDCSALAQLYQDETTVSPLAAAQVLPPSGGLYGSASIINVGAGTDYTYDANAYIGLFTNPKHTAPFAASPTIADALPRACITSDAGDLYCGAFSRVPGDAVSAVMMRSVASAEWVIAADIGAGTDLVFNFPTKHLYTPSGEICRTATDALNPTALPPFSSNFCSPAPGQARTSVDFASYDRAARVLTEPDEICFLFCPVLPAPTYAAQVQTISNSSVLGSTQQWNYGTPSRNLNFSTPRRDSGFVDVKFSTPPERILRSDQGATKNGRPCGQITLRGLPVTGFSVQIYRNGAIGGILSNYGGNFALRFETDVTCE
jgi:hypothetical protein